MPKYWAINCMPNATANVTGKETNMLYVLIMYKPIKRIKKGYKKKNLDMIERFRNIVARLRGSLLGFPSGP